QLHVVHSVLEAVERHAPSGRREPLRLHRLEDAVRREREERPAQAVELVLLLRASRHRRIVAWRRSRTPRMSLRPARPVLRSRRMGTVLLEVVILLALALGNGIFALSEIAVVSSRKPLLE